MKPAKDAKGKETRGSVLVVFANGSEDLVGGKPPPRCCWGARSTA
ncbi:MAG: hypothetical protein R2682_05810 [Pyrinomonadaceae bacterium]